MTLYRDIEEDAMLAALIRAFLRVYGLLLPGGTRHSRIVEGDAGAMRLGDKLWWAHKFFVHPVEHAQRHTDIETRLTAPLRFAPPRDFIAVDSITVTSAGDLLTSEHIRPETAAHLWDEVAEWAFSADLALANLETPVSPSRAQAAPPRSILKAPPLNSSREMLRVFTGSGSRFTFFSTANNHCLDQGIGGLRETLDVLDAECVGFVGTSRSPVEQDDVPIVERGGIRIAILSYSFSVNGREFPTGTEYSVNLVRLNAQDPDLSLIRRHLEIARRQKNADVVLACLHWSLEFESFPVQPLIDTAHRIAALGVDALLGNHPHTVQPLEQVRVRDPFSGFEKDVLIAYAHGDTVSWLPNVPNSTLGLMLRTTIVRGIEKGRTVTRITAVEHRFITRRFTFDGERCVDVRVVGLDDEIARETTLPSRSEARLAELHRLQELGRRLIPAGEPAARATIGLDGPQPDR
ncbi:MULTISPECIES: CapA family protein [unclassified Microbacterium]|uniref:CapA family protein n=1 Tax=unclassified Microbacterium TaxID=2609290 RepID=UPI00365B855B